ncbi:hypothetical protein [Kocuria sp.]|uniref:hypothetical protein n=1 Tax=Kocuria sp. TaxID=1871328 RepID=UPI0025C11507|nr:hypothetical protein [Kocuria sp.]
MAKHLFLPRTHPTSLAFLDETGSISQDRFFAVGLLLHPEPSRVLRSIQKYRDRNHYYGEFHLTELTQGALNTYKGFVDTVLADRDFRFFCFVADRDLADPVRRSVDGLPEAVRTVTHRGDQTGRDNNCSGRQLFHP